MHWLTEVVVGLSICISTTSPSMISVSSLQEVISWIIEGQGRKVDSLYPDTNALTKGLSESLRLAHLQGKDFTTRDGSEWRVCSQCLGHTYRKV